ncbi:MAG TPA: glutaredoxin 3 [Terriglobales bacterium]|nr:glutaredoxin 3 [Terriglobales bacterium]
MAQVVIYTTPYCSYCRAAKALLSSKRIEFEEIDVSRDPDRRAEMERRSKRHTVPQIFINGVAVGGFDNLRQLQLAGDLDRLLERN